MELRNVAIIAHVDHGKTTLVDKILEASGELATRRATVERVMDSNDQERERGITILSKNTAIRWKGIKINVIDTPGHSDFGGEVERVLSMADGVLLLVDAFEGPMPQTRFVLRKALDRGLRPLVVVNKIDRPDQRAAEVIDEVFDLFCELTDDESLIEFPVVYASARDGYAMLEPDQPGENLDPLLDAILEKIPAPPTQDGPVRFQVSTLDYSDYVGTIGIGRVFQGHLRVGQAVAVLPADGSRRYQANISQLFTFQGLERVPAERVECGDVAALVGLEKLGISDTVCHPESSERMPIVAVDEPTMSMLFRVNDSPFAGREGSYVTSRHVRERLDKELYTNVALRVEDEQGTDGWRVSGRGVLHLSVLIETLRREGYELCVGKPQVIYREIDGVRCEPIELLIIDVPTTHSGKMIEIAGGRRAEVKKLESTGDMTHLEMASPSRGMVGLRTRLLTASAGEAIVHQVFQGYEPYKGDIVQRSAGVQVSMETGKVVAYALDALRDRGEFFVAPGDQIYEGQVLGEHCRGNDIIVNPCRAKKLTNVRASGSDKKIILAPPRLMSLEEALEYIEDDELIEVTPKSIRLRKILLNEKERKRSKAS